MIGWEMAEILHFEILRKHGQTNTQTDMGITIPRPPPMGGEVIIYEGMRDMIRMIFARLDARLAISVLWLLPP